MSKQQSEPNGNIRVRLLDYSRQPYNLAIASARTCYSKRGIVTPEDVSATPEARELRDRIGESTLMAGHLTTRQHPSFVFAIENVSRHLVWSFLHSHPYYNSEQVSQRYVEVSPDSYYVPSALANQPELKKLYTEILDRGGRLYTQLNEELMDVAEAEYFKVFKSRASKREKWLRDIKRKAMEAARYALPVAMHTVLYHTINGLTLHRYRRLSESFDLPEETRELIDQMYQLVAEVDPDFAGEFFDPLPLEESEEYKFFSEFYDVNQAGQSEWSRNSAAKFVSEFDAELGKRTAKLVGYQTNGQELLGAATRAVLGVTSDSLSNKQAIELLLNPQQNGRLQSTLNEMSLSKVTRALFNVHYTFQKKISHTADSQDQRHRMVPGSRPVLMAHYAGEPDYITPALIQADSAALEIYQSGMSEIFKGINRFLESGGHWRDAQYLLPNSFPIRFYESGDLLNLHHKWKARTCYNAQEEIFWSSVEEINQVAEIHPELARWMRPPCWLRKESEVKPYCPEGDRYCGVPVWTLELEDYQRVI